MTMSALTLRSSRALSAMNILPVFVVVPPPLPVKATTSATAGSAFTISAKLRHSLLHCREGRVLRSLNPSRQTTGVLLQEKSFGHDYE